VNSPQVISETVGGETIIVNLASGHYFSLQGTAPDIWNGIERGDDAASIVHQLEQRYETTGDDDIGAAVNKLLDDFVAAELIIVDGNGTDSTTPPPLQTGGDRIPFVAPSFTTFTDMQDIILLDPVHEVDTRGWPHASANA
jgi:Coenzyme PQQ synthesis protein D (PqqD)